MKSGIPWNLRGVDEETREAVLEAARRSGLSVGEWLNQVLAEDGQGYAEPEDTTTEPDVDDGDDSDAGELAQAIERLTQRLGAMDDKSRAGVSGLKERLDEIEHQVSRLPDARLAGGERMRSLKIVSALVADLAREIDNADERARSMVEGLRARVAAPDIGRVREAIGELDQRIAAMDQRVTSLSPATDPRPPRLDDIRQRLNRLLAEAPSPPSAPAAPSQAAFIDAALRALEGRIDDAKARMAEREAKPVEPAPATAEQIERIEAKLGDISNRLAESDVERKGPQKEAVLATAIREISAHQRTIDDRAETLAMRRDQKALAAAMAALRTEIGDLTEHVSAITRIGAEDHGAFFDLARRIDSLAADKPVDRNLLAAIRDDLETMRGMIEGGAQQSTLGAIEAYHEGDRAKLDSLGEEISALRRSLEAADSPRAIQRLEMRVSELGQAIEAALTDRRADIADPAIERVEGRLQDIASRLDGLGDTSAHTAAIDTAQRQLDSRLEDIVNRLGGIADTGSQGAIEHVHERLQAITDRIDKLNASQHEPSAALDAVKAEIGALRTEIAGKEPPRATSTDHLEAQIRALATQLEAVAGAKTEDHSLADLEAQVAHLASELEETKPHAASLHHVEETLERLQAMLADTVQGSVASARAEARKAVSELSDMVAGSEIDADVVRGLMRDLDSLRNAAGDTDQTVRSKLETVGGTLSQVVERLSRLESEANSLTARASSDTPISEPNVAEAEPQPLLWKSGFRIATTDAGATKDVTPAVAAVPEKKPLDRRADFIAAARRAAQAAQREVAAVEATTAEAAIEEATPPAERRPGAFSRISRAIRNRKRPLLLAAAAIVLAIGAMQVYGKLTSTIAADRTNLIAAADVATVDSAAAFRDPVATASIAPTSPRVTAQALVPPPTTPDSSIAFAKPEGLQSHFGGGTSAPATNSFDTADASAPATASAPQSADVDPILLASTAPMPAPNSSSGLDVRLGSAKLIAAADGGDPAAAFEIATRYADGTRVRKDLAKAAEWYAKAADGGVAVAQYRLGSLYERGQGVTKNLTSAVNWYQRAADQGNVNAMHNLAVLMSEGVEGVPDHEKALQWFLAAGNYGVRDSQYNLGVIYARGLGMTPDLPESYKWFAIAAAQGDTDASARRDEVAKALTPDDLAKARAAVTAWHVKPPLAEANGVSAPGGGWDGPGDTIGEADRAALVKKIQTLLADQGFDPGPADGVVGKKTVDAVRAYQRKSGVPETGQIDTTLVASLADGQ